MNEIKMISEELVNNVSNKLANILSNMESSMKSCTPVLNGEHFIREGNLGKKLKLSRRTLQDYRDKGYLPYYKIGGTILYKESDIESILVKNYRSAWTTA